MMSLCMGWDYIILTCSMLTNVKELYLISYNLVRKKIARLFWCVCGAISFSLPYK